MGRKPKEPKRTEAYRHDETRKNNPEAGLVEFVPKTNATKREYCWDPRESPQLIWAKKAGMKKVEVDEEASIEVPIVNLHIHERISAEAILRSVRREDAQRSLFADPELEFTKEIQFYQHDVDWSNRMILGDSLLIMNSLLEREGMRGQVQCIYMDPPYGIKYASNFQPRIDQRDVKDGKDEDLTREVMQVQAFRDTWELGVHSYLTYLRDRLLLARELLKDEGSIFVQIGDENVHRVRCLMDEVFGEENFCCEVAFMKTPGLGMALLDSAFDTILWYCRSKGTVKYRKLYDWKAPGEAGATQMDWIEDDFGMRRQLGKEEPRTGRMLSHDNLTSQTPSDSITFGFELQGRTHRPRKGGWKTNADGMRRLIRANRLMLVGDTPRYVRFLVDFPVFPLNNVWQDTNISGFGRKKEYVVETLEKVVARCILMTTDPGDLVLDPTCVRKGTRVLTPSQPPPQAGEENCTPLCPPATCPPATGGNADAPSPPAGRAGERWKPAAIENLRPGDWVIAHDGQPHRVLRTIKKRSVGEKYGFRVGDSLLWVTGEHRILCKKRLIAFDHGRWSEMPKKNFERAREMRKDLSKSERILWRYLRGKQSGFRFRRQHPIGPFIADFYSREAALVIEIDGDAHFRNDAAQAYDESRNCFMQKMGLTVLRFTGSEVLRNLDGVMRVIQRALDSAHPSDIEGWEWRTAESLRAGDVVLTPSQPPPQAGEEHAPSPFTGRAGEGSSISLHPATVTEVLTEQTDEEVYDLEVEGAHSFVTETCVVHNCGSGTTAYVAEQWGRRWITMDTSRVALAIARHRLMTAAFDYYRLRYPPGGAGILPASSEGVSPSSAKAKGASGVSGGFVYKTVPHITLKSIAQNMEIDEVAAEYQPQIAEALADLNKALRGHRQKYRVSTGGREGALLDFTASDSKTTKLPSGQEVRVNALLEWEVPREFPDDWPKKARESHEKFWRLRREMQSRIDESISRNAPIEELVDQPLKEPGIVRVSGPFTIEAVPNVSAEISVEVELEVIPSDEGATEVKLFTPQETEIDAANAAAHVANMIEALRKTGVVVDLQGQRVLFENLRPLNHEVIHAEGELAINGHADADDPDIRNLRGKVAKCAVVFGPKNGALSEVHVRDALRAAAPYDAIVFCAYEFTAPAQEVIHSDPIPGKRLMMAHIAPDTVMADLLKNTKASQLFTLVGEPDVLVYRYGDPDLELLTSDAGERAAEIRRRLKQLKLGQIFIEVRGVDLYDPVTGETKHDTGGDIHAIFIDHNYDGKSFCICQALFPNKRDSWQKIARSLKGTIDEEAFEAMRSQVSLPFEPGEKVQVKVIDARGNAVVKTIGVLGTLY